MEKTHTIIESNLELNVRLQLNGVELYREKKRARERETKIE